MKMKNQFNIICDFFQRADRRISLNHEKPIMIFPLWRANRMSLSRSISSISVFFPRITIRKQPITMRVRRSNKLNKKTYLLSVFLYLTKHLFDFVEELPPLKMSRTIRGYVLILPSYYFVMRLPIKISLSIFTSQLISDINTIDYGKIYKTL